jgi:hypothetical protein
VQATAHFSPKLGEGGGLTPLQVGKKKLDPASADFTYT